MASARQRFLARIATGSSVVLEEGRSMAGVTRYSMVFAVVAAAVIGALALTL